VLFGGFPGQDVRVGPEEHVDGRVWVQPGRARLEDA